MSNKLRIGIYAGAFDPVHAGHVAFALQAKQAARLDKVVFLPERRPRRKPGVEHYGHRIAMLKAALAPHPDLAVMEVVDRHFTVRRMLPLLQAAFPKAELVFLVGSDAVSAVPHWDHAERLLSAVELVVGVRQAHQSHAVEQIIDGWSKQPRRLIMVNSFAPGVSSTTIRQALRENRSAEGLLHSVRRYARREWLYVSPAYISV